MRRIGLIFGVLLLVIVMGCNVRQKSSGEIVSFKRAMDTTFVTPEETRVERFSIFSPSMQRDIKVVVVLPPEYTTHPEKKYPILYTLHGYGAPYNTWAQMPLLRKELKNKPFIYTCFDGDIGSQYIDSYNPLITVRKPKTAQDSIKRVSLFNTFFFKEFIPALDTWYRINDTKRGVTGFSMGGEGAMMYMLNNPDMFCSVSGLSSAYFDFSDTTSKEVKGMSKYLGAYEDFPSRYNTLDHYTLLKKHIATGTKLPPVFQYIGASDFLLGENRKMAAFAKVHHLDYTYVETEGGHNWDFWHPASVEIAAFHWNYFK